MVRRVFFKPYAVEINTYRTYKSTGKTKLIKSKSFYKEFDSFREANSYRANKKKQLKKYNNKFDTIQDIVISKYKRDIKKKKNIKVRDYKTKDKYKSKYIYVVIVTYQDVCPDNKYPEPKEITSKHFTSRHKAEKYYNGWVKSILDMDKRPCQVYTTSLNRDIIGMKMREMDALEILESEQL